MDKHGYHSNKGCYSNDRNMDSDVTRFVYVSSLTVELGSQVLVDNACQCMMMHEVSSKNHIA